MTATRSAQETTARTRADRSKRRLIGVDIARFVALFGMCNIHFGVPFFTGDAEIWLAEVSSGRSTALFTFLAGVSLALLSGRAKPLTGPELREARMRIAVRAGVLIVLGILLAKATEATGFLLTVIIPFYGVYFLLSIPFVGLGVRGLTVAASIAALTGPQLSFVLRSAIAADTPLTWIVDTVNAVDPGHLWANMGVFDLLLMNFYPAMSYLPLVLAGMAVGRMNLRAPRVRIKLALLGLVLALIAYHLSDLLVDAVGGLPDAESEGSVPVEHPDWLLGTTSHSGTTFELVGALGIALIVLVVCLELADRTRGLLWPLAAAGSMALSLYALHAGVMSWQIVVGGWRLSEVPAVLSQLESMGPDITRVADLPAYPYHGPRPQGALAFVNEFMPELFLIFVLAFAVTWRRFFRRGPVEGLVSSCVQWVVDRKNARERRRRTAEEAAQQAPDRKA